MKRTGLSLTFAVLASGTHVVAVPITVNCDQGGSLNRVIALLPRAIPSTVTVNGTCTEYVAIRGIEALTVRSSTGATLPRPPGDGGQPCLFKEPSPSRRREGSPSTA